MDEPSSRATRGALNGAPRFVAYFSMEVALETDIPTYAGGLGVLAGDTLRSAADLALPIAGVTLLYRKGYFLQRIDAAGRQHEEPVVWEPEKRLRRLDATCHVEVEGRAVVVRAWEYPITGVTGALVPVLLLDTDVPENDPRDRSLTDQLYGGDARYRLAQEIVLGIGGVRMLRTLGHDPDRFHLNEGHAALLTLERFREEIGRQPQATREAIDRVRAGCVFTTHTPVRAGHDEFPLDLARDVLGAEGVETLAALECTNDGLDMTRIALQLSGYVNGVSRRHAQVSRSMFPGHDIAPITNGVHSVTWTAPSFQELYDRAIPNWRRDPLALRYVLTLPADAVWEAHQAAKARLVHEANARFHAGFRPDVFTLGFARRATAYKRPVLLFQYPDRLRRMAVEHGGLQIVFAGKAHPKDEKGKQLIERVIAVQKELAPDVKVVYLPNYSMELGALVTSGVDVWVNTPKPPHEASGTSGMKAAHNGVPSLSTIDGWWVEGHVEGVTGWAIGPHDA
ncbi:MAG: alpha-glucan family phosphorylase, partial [Gemmatimonadota bacterium]